MPEPEGEIYKAIERFRRDLLRRERQAASELVRVYGEAWKRIKARLDELENEYQALKALGEKPGAAWIFERNRLQALRQQIERELEQFGRYAEETVRQEQRQAIAAAEQQAEALARKALGKAPQGIWVNWHRIDTAAVEQMLGFTRVGSPLHHLLRDIAGEGAKAAEDALVQGMLLGQNPREVAREMRRALGTTLIQALTIARTETLRAHREATRASYQANSDIVKGWIWHSAADERTCAACWAMHGTEHRLDEILDDHPNGRCAMIPKTRTWAEIGKQYGIDLSGVPDTNPEIEPGVLLFDKLPAEKQIKILGPAKWAAWKDGRFVLSDIVGRARSKEWGTHRFEKSLVQLLGEEKAKGYTRLALMGAARNAGQYSVDDLIRVAGLGLRELTPGELERIVRHVANAGFDSTEMMRVRTSIRGQVWDGKKLEIGDTIPTDVWHYLKHVVVNQEWPDGTTLEDYKRSLEEVILDQDSDIFVSKYNDAWQIGFVHENQGWRGVRGKDFILVEYKVKYGHWTTGFQPQNLKRQVFEGRENIVWLRNRILK